MASIEDFMNLPAPCNVGAIVPEDHWESRMTKIAGRFLWQPSNGNVQDSQLPKEGGGEAGMGQWLETACSTSGYSSQDSGTLQHCEPGKRDRDTEAVVTKRKVGRPIAYQGDPDSPDLDPEQRQIILRRIANRRSARRGRERRQDEMDKLAKRLRETEAANAALKAKVRESESKDNEMQREMAALQERAQELAVKNRQMQHNFVHLTSALVDRRQARQLVPGHTTAGGAPTSALLSAAPVPTPPATFGFQSVPDVPFPPGYAPELHAPTSPMPGPPSSFTANSPVSSMPEHYLRELLHVVNWTN